MEHNFHGVYGVLKTVIVFLWSSKKFTMEHHGVLGVLCSSKMCFSCYGFKVM